MMGLTLFSNAREAYGRRRKKMKKWRALRSGDDRDHESRIGRRVGALSPSQAASAPEAHLAERILAAAANGRSVIRCVCWRAHLLRPVDTLMR